MKKENEVSAFPLISISGNFNDELYKKQLRGIHSLINSFDGYRLDNLEIKISFESLEQFDKMIEDLPKFEKFLLIHKYCFFTPKKDKAV